MNKERKISPKVVAYKSSPMEVPTAAEKVYKILKITKPIKRLDSKGPQNYNKIEKD